MISINSTTNSFLSLSILGLIPAFTFFPLIFNFMIIPGIEKKVGQKLKFTSFIYKVNPISFYLMRYLEIALYIAGGNFAFLLRLNRQKRIVAQAKIWASNSARCSYPGLPLLEVKYNVRNASYFELIMSYLAVFNIIQLFVIGGYLYFSTPGH